MTKEEKLKVEQKYSELIDIGMRGSIQKQNDFLKMAFKKYPELKAEYKEVLKKVKIKEKENDGN